MKHGQTERRVLLAGEGIIIPGQLDGPVGKVPPDDLFDAAAAAWCALRYATGRAGHLPLDPRPGEGITDGWLWF